MIIHKKYFYGKIINYKINYFVIYQINYHLCYKMNKGCKEEDNALNESKDKQEKNENNNISKENDITHKKQKKKNFLIIKQKRNKNFQYWIDNNIQKTNNYISNNFVNFGNNNSNIFKQINYNGFPINFDNNFPIFQKNKKKEKKNQIILIINNYINIENPSFKSNEETNKKENIIINSTDSKTNIIESPSISTITSVKNQQQSVQKKNETSSIKFIVAKNNTNEENNSIIKMTFLNKKRGRKSSKKGKREHSAFDQDNIIRKIQVHYISFIIDFTNDVIQNVLIDNKELIFKSINYEFKKTVNHSYLEKLNFLAIGDILKLKISPKIKKYKENINELIYNKLYNMNNFFKTFFETSYLELFNKYYYQEEREVNVNGYKIKLSEKTKLFTDLLTKNKSSADKIKEIAEEYFVSKKKNTSQIFFIKKI